MTDRIRRHGYALPSDTRLAAWEIVIGENDLSSGRSRKRKPHRGSLPDVDFGAAVRDLERRSLLRRIVERVWRGAMGRRPEPADPILSASSAAPLGRTASRSYMRLADTSADSPSAPDRSEMSHPRAA